jgi:hypothetical protein
MVDAPAKLGCSRMVLASIHVGLHRWVCQSRDETGARKLTTAASGSERSVFDFDFIARHTQFEFFAEGPATVVMSEHRQLACSPRANFRQLSFTPSWHHTQTVRAQMRVRIEQERKFHQETPDRRPLSGDSDVRRFGPHRSKRSEP